MFDSGPVPPGARVVKDPDELDEFFADNRGVHVYALADLDDVFWSASRWIRRGDAVIGAVAMPNNEAAACYAVATRDVAGTVDLLADLAPSLPSQLLVVGSTGSIDALRAVRPLAWSGDHMRYQLTDRTAADLADDRVEPLGPDGLEELAALYSSDPGAAFFLPHMLADNSYVGVREAGELVAAAGTHVLSERRGVAAIGAVFARRTHRGRGLGRAVTTGVIARIADRAEVIGLNVAADNHPARRIYESIGFVSVIAYEEAELA